MTKDKNGINDEEISLKITKNCKRITENVIAEVVAIWQEKKI